MTGTRLDRAAAWLRSQPHGRRVALVAAVGIIASWITYELVYWLMPAEPRATLSWTIAFSVGVIRQHHLHRNISFPGTRVRYRTSLARDVGVNVVVALTSTGLNWFLTVPIGLPHRMAWAICIVFVATLTYGAMRLFVFRGNEQSRRILE